MGYQQVKIGRTILIIVIVFTVLLEMLSSGFQVQAGRFGISSVGRMFLTVFLLMYVWDGSKWARWILVVLLFAAAGLMVTIALTFPAISERSDLVALLIGLGVIYLMLSMGLASPWMGAYQNARRPRNGTEVYHDLAMHIALKTRTEFSPAEIADLDYLRSLCLPPSVIDFYTKYEPKGCAEGQVRLLSIDDIRRENSELTPGAYVSPLGYVVFATTFCGDVYCFNINQQRDGEPEIVLISHEVVEEGISSDDAAKIAKPVAKNLSDFLKKFIDNQLDENCIYP